MLKERKYNGGPRSPSFYWNFLSIRPLRRYAFVSTILIILSEWPRISNELFNDAPIFCVPDTVLKITHVYPVSFSLHNNPMKSALVVPLQMGQLAWGAGDLPRVTQLVGEPGLEPAPAQLQNGAHRCQPRLSPRRLCAEKPWRNVAPCHPCPVRGTQQKVCVKRDSRIGSKQQGQNQFDF